MLSQRFDDCSMTRANLQALKNYLKKNHAVLHAEQHPTAISNTVELRKCRLEYDDAVGGKPAGTKDNTTGFQAVLQQCSIYGLLPVKAQ